VSLSSGIRLFDAGRYWEAHEAWEEVWMHDRRGPESGFYKGLIQVAPAAFTTRGETGAAPSTNGDPAPVISAHTCPATRGWTCQRSSRP
jgi:hypothetical protein